MASPTDHQPLHRLLRTFRSHKNLRAEEPSQQNCHRPRQPSGCSCGCNSSTTRPSTESGRPSTTSWAGRPTLERDPLRLNPTMIVPTGKSRIPSHDDHHRDGDGDVTPTPARPRHLRGTRSMHNTYAGGGSHNNSNPNSWAYSSSPASSVSSGGVSISLEIHDGFDFGFASSSSTVKPSTHGECPSPALSSASGLSAVSDDSEWGRHHSIVAVTPRPLPAAGRSQIDDFIKRGGWKRRGIVFSTEETAEAPEEECFYLDVL